MEDIKSIRASNEDVIHADYRCLTRSRRFECSLTWIINNLSLYFCSKSVKNVLVSPSFSATKNTCNWLLEFRPTHEEIRLRYDNYDQYRYLTQTQLNLKLKEENEIDQSSQILGEVQCSLINSEGKKCNLRKEKFSLDKNNRSVKLSPFITDEQLFQEENKLLPNDTLTIYCEISFIRKIDITNILNRDGPNLLNMPKCNPMDDFAKLFNNKDCSDVEIYINDRTFSAHKVILAARSPIFKAMFSHSMIENCQNRIDIKDIDSKLFEELLRFIYTGKVENLDEFAFELLLVADKYNIEGLMCMCEIAICNMITVETVLKTLLFSEQHNLKTLRTQAMEYIKVHSAEVMESSEWDNFSSEAVLMKEICETCNMR